MGLREILTRPISFGNPPEFKWSEPVLYRIRLRGDAFWRLAIVLGAWGVGVGVFSMLFVFNVHRPGPELALGLGLVPAGLAVVLVFLLREHVSGRVQIDKSEIRRQRSYAGIMPGTWSEWQYFELESIDGCTIVAPSAIGRSFAVAVLACGRERHVIGIPRSVDLKQLAKFLSARGVDVSAGKGLPRPIVTPLHPAIRWSVPVLGLLVCTVGLSWLITSRQDLAINRPERPRFDDGQDPGFVPPEIGFPPAVGNQPDLGDGADSRRPPNVPASPFPSGEFGPDLTGIGGPPGFPTGPMTIPRGSGGSSSMGSSVGPTVPHRKTEAVGGSGGVEFLRAHPENKPVLGIRSRFGSWAGNEWIGQLEPLYGDEPDDLSATTVLARPGYAVAGLVVDAPDMVQAYAVVFQRRLPDGDLDTNDVYTSDWVGKRSMSNEITLSSQGRDVLGVFGRSGAVVDAIGLVVAQD